jgi:hypothetical protein
MEAFGSRIGTKIWNQSASGASDALEAPVLFGGPSRTRTLDPLIKSAAPDTCIDRDEHARTGIYEQGDDRERRLEADESGHVGTNVEPDPRTTALSVRRVAPLAPPKRSVARPVTYREVRAYVYSRHRFSPRTGWIAHVKELNGLTLRPTHNRQSPARIDACPPERRSAIEEALRHFGLLPSR